MSAQILPNGNLHIRIHGLTVFCGSLALARLLYQALGNVLSKLEC